MRRRTFLAAIAALPSLFGQFAKNRQPQKGLELKDVTEARKLFGTQQFEFEVKTIVRGWSYMTMPDGSLMKRRLR